MLNYQRVWYVHGYMVVALDGPLSEGFQHLSGSREVRLQLKGSLPTS